MYFKRFLVPEQVPWLLKRFEVPEQKSLRFPNVFWVPEKVPGILNWF